MTALHFATGRRSAWVAAFNTRAIAAAANLLRAWRNRRDFYRLSDLSDAELKDIGLTRADLHVAFARPFGLDPTVRLREVVDKRIEHSQM